MGIFMGRDAVIEIQTPVYLHKLVKTKSKQPRRIVVKLLAGYSRGYKLEVYDGR